MPANGVYCLSLNSDDHVNSSVSTDDDVPRNLNPLSVTEASGPSESSIMDRNSGSACSVQTDQRVQPSKETETIIFQKIGKLNVYPWTVRRQTSENSVISIGDCDIKQLVNPEIGSLCDNYGEYAVICNIEPLCRELPQEVTAATSELTNEGLGSQVTADMLLDIATKEQTTASERLLNVLGESIRVRVQAQSDLCAKCLENQITHHKSHEMPDSSDVHLAVKSKLSGSRCEHARTAILFSGGIDSLMLAALADRYCNFLLLSCFSVHSSTKAEKCFWTSSTSSFCQLSQ